MNHSLLLVLALLAAPALAQTQVGYTTGNMGRTTVFHYGNNTQQGMAIRLSHDKLQALQGHQITAVNTAFGSVNAIKDKQAQLFVATSLTADPVLQQSATISKANAWQQIALTSPYTITGLEPELIVGYRVNSATSNVPEALQGDRVEGCRGCSYAWDGSSWCDLFGSGNGSPNLRLVLDGQLSFTDAMLSELSFSDAYYQVGQDYQYSTRIYNFGTQPITSLDVTVQIGADRQTLSYPGLNIAQYGTYEFTLPVLTSAATGATDVQVSISVNGGQDVCAEDDAFASSAFFYPAGFERSILVEEFTGMTCPNCPNGARTLHQVMLANGLPCVQVNHHSGSAPDPYSCDADYDYTWYFGSAGTFAPAAMINRLYDPAVNDVPAVNAQISTTLEDLFQSAAARQPYVSLGLASSFDADSRRVDVTLDVAAINDLPGASLINVYLVQDSIIGYQSNGGTNYAHNGLLRRVLTGNSWGLLLPDDFGQGQQQQWTTSFQLPDSIFSDFWTPELLAQANYTERQVTIPTDAAHMRIVAYVASYNPQNIRDNEVYNCIEVPLINGRHIQHGMPGPEALQQLPAAPAVPTIHDLSGRLIQGPATPGTSTSAPGLYIINGKKVMLCK